VRLTSPSGRGDVHAEATAREEGKPEQALPRIVEGRVNGFFKDVVLLEQASVHDSKKTVKVALEEAGVTVTRFALSRSAGLKGASHIAAAAARYSSGDTR